MIQFTNIEPKQQNINFGRNQKYSAHKPQNIHKVAPRQFEHKKISFSEGTEIFMGGVLKQGKEMITSIVQHPLKAAAVMAGTTLGIMALPLIGIPSAVGGGLMAIGFAGLALTKAIKHAREFARTNQDGSYDLARVHLQQMGEDTFDLALSVPFVPKAITSIKNFVKYGKFGFNSTLFNEVKASEGFIGKLKTLTKADAEMTRSFNFQNAVDKELSLLTELPEATKAQIKQELLEFNVAAEQLPQITIEKYAQAKGIKTQPHIKYTTMSKNTHGMAVADNCTIYLNDYKPYSGPSAFAEWSSINQELKNGQYFITYKNNNTGAVIVESIEAEILNRYNDLCNIYKSLSPEAAKILTILHERHHIYQFAQAFGMKGFDWARGVKPEAKQRFEQMITEMPKVQFGTPEAMVVETYTQPLANSTPLAYIKRPLEIGAREIEQAAIDNPIFLSLDEIFKTVYKSKNLSIGENILINDIRMESSKV
jgi:hypothetical protein